MERALCPDNEELLEFMLKKRKELVDKPKGIAENVEKTLQKAYSNIRRAKNPIRTLKDLSQIKGVGKWILTLLKEFFKTNSDYSESEDVTENGKKTKATRRYLPQKNSVSYALLITLYRVMARGGEFMRKQELIDAAEASGLSRAPVGPELGKGKAARFGSSPRDWYSGWSSMKTLIAKGLVVKSSNPAKYKLTEEGQQAARDCLARSGLDELCEPSTTVGGLPNMDSDNISKLQHARADISKDLASESFSTSTQKKSEVPFGESLERYKRMGYSEEQIIRAFTEVSKASPDKEISSLWPAVLCRLKEEQVYGCPSMSQKKVRQKTVASRATGKCQTGQVDVEMIDQNELGSARDRISESSLRACSSSLAAQSSLRACSSTYRPVDEQSSSRFETSMNVLSMPPLRFGENFDEAYVVILILDDREQFTAKGARSRKIVENISTQFKIQIEVRRLPVGDGIWVARHKQLGNEYVLDFIVERKNVDDLRSSIRDNRYKDQKLRLLRCGLKKLIYMVEGDANASEAAESIKTACFTTEILEGFDVQRTSGLGDTLRRYASLTHSIAQYYKLLSLQDKLSLGICPSFDEFIRRCRDHEKMTVSDVFAIQLMQVPQVTEEIAVAVLDLYPTVLALARAYSLLEGDVCGQEEMLKKQSNNTINTAASKNIYQLVWGSS